MESPLEHDFEAVRKELTAYLGRLVVRTQVAEDLAQATFLRCLETPTPLPGHPEGRRAWFFRVATNLAFDTLRRHSTWRESLFVDLRNAAESDPEFVERSREQVGSPETVAIAREHLVACLVCTLRNLPERRAAALLLKEVHGFSVEEVADLLEATPAQAKNWLQEARAFMVERYGATCALIAKNGVCHQCVELDGYFAAGQGNPLASGGAGLDARLRIAAELRDRPWGSWHRRLFELLDDLP